MLPTFVIAGAMRSGTTTLYRNLVAHPEVAGARTKELHFFDGYFDRGLGWYEQQFAGPPNAKAVGEATPNYCYDDQAVPRMAETLPEVRVIMVLRNPIDRAYSHFWHSRARDKESLDFEAALDAEPERLRGGRMARSNHSYVDAGRYLTQMQRIYDHFPKEHVLVQIFEEMVADPDASYQEACRFIGVDDGFEPPELGQVTNPYITFRSMRARDLIRRLPGRTKRIFGPLLVKKNATYPEMATSTRARLRDEFADDITGLESLLGRDLDVWRQSA